MPAMGAWIILRMTVRAWPGEVIGAALAVTVTVPPGESREVAFSLAWAMPVVRSGFGTPYYRRYTLFYGKQPQAARSLAQDALEKSGEWEEAIAAWQRPILEDASLPVLVQDGAV